LRVKGTRRHLRVVQLWVCSCPLSSQWKTLKSQAPQWSAQPLVELWVRASASAVRSDEPVLPFR
jgi:hypothetical protein